jgi:hypothetical protein
LGEPAGQILPQIFDLALDPHFNRFGEGLPPGESYSPTMRAALTTSMASLGAAAVPDLTVNLQYPDPKVRRMAAEALGKIGPAARTSVPRLIELLDDEQAWDAAAEALGRIGPDAHAAVPKLLEALEAMRGRPDPSDYDPDENDPSEYDWTGYDMNEYVPRLHALGGIGAASRDAAPEVFRLANFDDMRIRHTAVLTLARIAPAHPSLVPLLRRWLCEWERKSTTADYGLSRSDRSIEEFADAVWELGPGAEEICRGHEIRGRE